MVFRNPQALFLLLLLPLFWALWRWRFGRVSAKTLALRLVMVSLVVLAVADPLLARPTVAIDMLVLLVDQSDSLGAAGQAALRTQAEALVRANEVNSTVHTVYFGANADVPEAATNNALPPTLRTDATDIASAMKMARTMIGSGGGRVVLLSDGGQTRGDALAEARSLQQAGIAVDTLAYQSPAVPDAWVAEVDAPRTLRVGEDYTINVTVGSREAATAQLQLFDGTTLLQQQDVTLAPGQNQFTYRSRAEQPGTVQLQATISSPDDSIEQNNSAATTSLVAPPPRVLLVEGQGSGAAPLRVGLRGASVETDVIQAADLPSQLSRLDAYEGVVLIDVPANNLTLDQMTTLREYVRSEGRGLVATGGRSSFTLGGYKDTPLEDVLPVEMAPPPRPQRADVTLLLIIDRSASMGPTTGASRFNMAKEAAILATNSLREGDRIGVLTFDTSQDWTVNFQQVGTGLSIAQIQEQISSIALGGGTDIYEALDTGLRELAAQPGQVRHAVLLTDGKSFSTARRPYADLIEQMRAQNITLSGIAIGEDADTGLLRDLANWGAGRYYFASKPEDIPRLTLQESEIARSEPQVEGEFRADLQAPHPLLRGFQPNQIPRLEGYVATTMKPEAELVLQSPQKDPVLAVWQYGLGRAVAWTPSIEEPWANGWASWPEYGQFWAEIIRYTLPEPDSGPLQVRVTSNGDEATITADSLLPGGAALDLADTKATITLPDGGTTTLPLRQVAPGRYSEVVKLPQVGPYTVAVQQQKDNLARQAEAGYVQPYSAEYLPIGDGAGLLQQISAATGGQVLTEIQGWSLGGGGNQPRSAELSLWLLLAAALLWPVEIAARRGWLGMRR